MIKKTLLLAAALFIAPYLFAQKLPKLMTTPFSYRECYPNHPDKKDRYCREFKFTITIVGDSLVITQTRGTKVEQPKKAEYFDVITKVHLKDLMPLSDEKTLSYKDETQSIKDLESNRQYFFRFTLHANGPKIMGYKFGKYTGDETYSIYCENIEDAKEFLIYLAGESYGM
ncbi:MAG: hypothetical protein AB7G44_06905 [Bacteroidia bacterium]